MNRLLVPEYLLLCFVIYGLLSCDALKKSDSKDPSEPPLLPELELFQPEVEFFTTSFVPKRAQDMRGYEMATELISTIVQPDVQRTYTFLPFLTRAEQAEPEFTNEKWEWNYSYSGEGQPFDVRLTAEEGGETSDNIFWGLYISNQGLSLSNYKLMGLGISPEGSRGNWIIYPIESDSTELWLDWSLDTATKYKEFTFNFYDNGSGTQRTIIYTREDHAHFIQIVKPGSNGHDIFVIQWNTETNVGSVDEVRFGGEQICWDENLNDTECTF